MTPRTRTALGALAAALLTLSACGGSGSGSSSDAEPSTSASDAPSDAAPDAASPDLDAIPDVVAEVNGEEVTKEEFVPIYEAAYQRATAEAQAGGAEPDEAQLRRQTARDLVDTELLAQEAEARGITVDQQAVEAELDAVAGQNGMESGEELLAAVVAQGGVTEEEALAQVRTQVMVELLVADEDGSAEPTEKDLRRLYARVKKQAATGQGAQQIPPYAQVRDQLAEQAQAERVGTVAGALVEDLRKDADITVNL
ncbi:SurA N-terminal domain-containing protein [Nocardioides xinjiangensis]|uniref:SurA N-terminal domain-containing protein n=1 Tax=Nocardioides xinjiangensis TaxID=2817376 RepID=UPI001B3087E8|nr:MULTISPECIES: SurA N-terminal domain-containing protein [unclassified Nocardioides]